jgi:ankyrin repeat protein
LIRAGTCLTPISNNFNEKCNSYKGETLIHLSARLGHEHILRRLIEETSYATRLTNGKGQTPLLCAIQSSYSSIATFLMEIDPLTITVHDNDHNSVFHYATNLCDDIVLSRAISLIKRLNNPHQRIQVNIFFCLKLI